MTTLADLLVRAHLHRSSFPKCAFHSMSKSVRRVAEAAGTLPQDHDAGGVLAEHAALAGKVDIGPKQFREEPANLTRLLDLPGLPADVPQRLFAGTAQVEDDMTGVGWQNGSRADERRGGKRG